MTIRHQLENRIAYLKEQRDAILDRYEDMADAPVSEVDDFHCSLSLINHKIHSIRTNLKDFRWVT